MKPKVFIIILTYNGKEDTIECLNSVKKLDYNNFEIVVVDNVSIDGTVEALKKKFPNVTILKSDKNGGFGYGNNIGMRYAIKKGCDYLFILNNDTIVNKDILTEMVKTYEQNENVGVVGVLELNYFQPTKIESLGGKINWMTVGRHAFHEGETYKGQFSKESEVDFISGAGFLISKEVINKVGFFDPIYFYILDDIEYYVRVKIAGYKLIVNPKAKIWHKVSNTTNRISGFTLYYATRNKFIFMKKNATKKQIWKFFRFFFIRSFPRDIKRFILEKEFSGLSTYLKAIISGVFYFYLKNNLWNKK